MTTLLDRRPQRTLNQRRRLIPALLTALLTATPAWSQDRLGLAGVEVGPSNSYTYAGLLMPAFGDNLSHGFVQRYWLDRVTYRYDSNGATIEAEALSAGAALGYVRPTAGGSISGMLGVLYRYTSLSPDDPGSAVRGGQWRIKAQGELNQTISDDLGLGLMGSYVFDQRGYWARARLGHSLGNGLRIGPELVFHGDPHYQVVQYGVFLTGLRLSPTIQAGFKVGVRNQRDESRRGYVGLELTRPF